MVLTVSSITGAVLLLAVAVMEILLIFGLPLGEFTMGGRYKVLPPMYRMGTSASAATLLMDRASG